MTLWKTWLLMGGGWIEEGRAFDYCKELFFQKTFDINIKSKTKSYDSVKWKRICEKEKNKNACP